ncbi:hypothetical protein PV327_010998 [Microctonus hyperodae]|uniref:Uncharacterized protein n=1 Tax=Microctonus hyperodae TaxID=165561 RepID=A0AA39C8N1_MICHY|nr:hypothetical protein PV327_010998 [Microctonus hyperodae]
MDIRETPESRRLPTAKRKKNGHTPQSADQKAKKKRVSSGDNSRTAEPESKDREPHKWQEYKRKRKPSKMLEPNRLQQPRTQRGKAVLPNALIVEAKVDGISYAEILSRIKKDQILNSC